MIDKVYEIIDLLDENEIIKRLDFIKKEIKNDSEIKKLIKEFNVSKENYEKYNLIEEYRKIKTKLLDNDIIKEYINIQNKINILSLKINKRINDLTKNITNE